MSLNYWQLFSYYVFLFPLVMSVVYAVGGVYFWFRREKRSEATERTIPTEQWPHVTILVPVHNEGATIQDTMQNLSSLDYPDYDVVFIDDNSVDNSADIIREHLKTAQNFHLIHLSKNVGKAAALNNALTRIGDTPIVVVLDADTTLKSDALKWLTLPFTYQPRLGAVTGNPVARNRKNLLEKIQTAEFASIIGLLKRSQRVMGRVLTVSGCATAYRTDVLIKVGGFSSNSATEDIDITWKLQKAHYEVWFAPKAVAYIEVPASFSSYWKQRERWALGGWHLLRTHKDIFQRWEHRRLWPIYAEFFLSYIWSLLFVFGTATWIITSLFVGEPVGLNPVPAWTGAVLIFACLFQFGAALLVNRQYDETLWQAFFYVPWYPLFFYVINALTVVWTAPKGLMGSLNNVGKWQSPARRTVKSLIQG